MDIKIRYFSDEVPRLSKIEKGDWIDLYAAKDMIIKEHEFVMIPLGIAMKLPEDYEAIVLPRSSTFKTWGIIMTNSAGVIDNSYSGTNDQWHFPAYCLDPKTFYCGNKVTKINKGDKICQFRIQKRMEPVNFIECEELDSTDRGGFGTTGAR